MNYTKHENLDEIRDWLKENLRSERYFHSIGTMNACVELAKMFGVDVEKAQVAGLLHDCAKCMSNEELLEMIKECIKDVKECELLNYKTLHAPVSAYLAKEQFGVTDEEILLSSHENKFLIHCPILSP